MSNEYVIVNTTKNNETVWSTIASTYTPSKGEVCIIVPTGNAFDFNPNIEGKNEYDLSSASVGIKIGDGDTVFKDLPLLTDVSMIHPDWNETDPTSPNFIKHKPFINEDMFEQSEKKVLTFDYEKLYNIFNNPQSVFQFNGHDYCLLKSLTPEDFSHPNDLLIEDDGTWGHYEIVYNNNEVNNQLRYFYKNNIIYDKEILFDESLSDYEYQSKIGNLINSLVKQVFNENNWYLTLFLNTNISEITDYFINYDLIDDLESYIGLQNVIYYSLNNKKLYKYKINTETGQGIFQDFNLLEESRKNDSIFRIPLDGKEEEEGEDRSFFGCYEGQIKSISLLIIKKIIANNGEIDENELKNAIYDTFGQDSSQNLEIVNKYANSLNDLINNDINNYNAIQRASKEVSIIYYEINNEIILDSNEKLYIRKDRLQHYLDQTNLNNEVEEERKIAPGESITSLEFPFQINNQNTFSISIYLNSNSYNKNLKDTTINIDRNEGIYSFTIDDDYKNLDFTKNINYLQIPDEEIEYSFNPFYIEQNTFIDLNSIANINLKIINNYEIFYQLENVMINMLPFYKDNIFNVENDNDDDDLNIGKDLFLSIDNELYNQVGNLLENVKININFIDGTSKDYFYMRNFLIIEDTSNSSKKIRFFDKIEKDSIYQMTISTDFKYERLYNSIDYIIEKTYIEGQPQQYKLKFINPSLFNKQLSKLMFKKYGEDIQLEYIGEQRLVETLPRSQDFDFVEYKKTEYYNTWINYYENQNNPTIREVWANELEQNQEFNQNNNLNLGNYFNLIIEYFISDSKGNYYKNYFLELLGILEEEFTINTLWDIAIDFKNNNALNSFFNILLKEYEGLKYVLDNYYVIENNELKLNSLGLIQKEELSNLLTPLETVLYKVKKGNSFEYYIYNRIIGSFEKMTYGYRYFTKRNDSLIFNVDIQNCNFVSNVKNSFINNFTNSSDITIDYENGLITLSNDKIITNTSNNDQTYIIKYLKNSGNVDLDIKFYYRIRQLKSKFLSQLTPDWDALNNLDQGYIKNKPLGKNREGFIGLAGHDGSFVITETNHSTNYHDFFTKFVENIAQGLISLDQINALRRIVQLLRDWQDSEHGEVFSKLLRENNIEVTINDDKYIYGGQDGETGVISVLKQIIKELIHLGGEVGQHGTVCVGTEAPTFSQCQLWINTNEEFGNGAAFYKIQDEENKNISWVPVSALWTNHKGLADFNGGAGGENN